MKATDDNPYPAEKLIDAMQARFLQPTEYCLITTEAAIRHNWGPGEKCFGKTVEEFIAAAKAGTQKALGCRVVLSESLSVETTVT